MTGADLELLDLPTVLSRAGLGINNHIGESSGRYVGLPDWLRRLGIRGVAGFQDGVASTTSEEVELFVASEYPPTWKGSDQTPSLPLEGEGVYRIEGRLVVEQDAFHVGNWSFNMNDVGWVEFEDEKWNAL